MVLVGKLSQLKWCDLVKASCWSKQRRSVLVTQSHSQSNKWWLWRSTYVDATYYREFLMQDIHHLIDIEITYELLLVSYELLRYHGIHNRTFRRELIRGPSLVSHAPHRLSCKRSHPRLMETHPSVAGIEHYQRLRGPYMIRTWLSSFFKSSLF